MNRFLPLVLTALILRGAVCKADDEPAPKKYALLVGVARYEHAEMNRPQPLEYPEADAKALGAALKKSGYEVVYLLGKDAVKEKIDAALTGLKKQGNDPGAILVGFFGHGVEYTRANGGEEIVESYFCPYDVELRSATDSNGNVLKRGDGEGDLVEPDPKTSISMTRVFDSLKLSKAGRRLVIADCCRNDPNAARGRSFGANVKISDLPPQTAVLFACSSGEKAYEDTTNGHGVFTDEILKRINGFQGDPLTASSLAESLERKVRDRVLSLTKGRMQQTPRYLSYGKVDLLLAEPPPIFDFADEAKSAEEAKESQAAWAKHLGVDVEVTTPLGIKLQLIPPGEFVMGRTEADESLLKAFPYADEDDLKFVSDEVAHRVRLTEPFWMSPTEVTVGQFKQFVDETGYVTDAEKVDPDREENGGFGWDDEKGICGPDPKFTWKEVGFPQGDNHPVVNVSWNDAQAYIAWLNAKHGGRWRLPTEAEWEYACRAGTTTRFHNGDDPKSLAATDNVADVSFNKIVEDDLAKGYLEVSDGHPFSAPVGSYAKANNFGLYDTHGNAAEWCEDLYEEYNTRRKVTENPVGKVGPERVNRGGSWSIFAGSARSVFRDVGEPDAMDCSTGFRLVRTP